MPGKRVPCGSGLSTVPGYRFGSGNQRKYKRFGSDFIRTDYALDACPNGSQQERRQMRMIGGLRFDLAVGAARFGPADRGHA